MVIIQKITEKLMGYRGSKSDFSLKSVKEQRVDGSWHKNNLFIFVSKVYSNGFRKKLSNQNPFLKNISLDFSSKKEISSLSTRQPVLHPYFVTGFEFI